MLSQISYQVRLFSLLGFKMINKHLINDKPSIIGINILYLRLLSR